MARFGDFIKESISEFKKMTWPTKEALWGGTLGVILISTFFVLYMWILDIIISKLLQLMLG